MSSLLLLIVVFIALSGLMAMVDAAILSVTRAEVEEMVVHRKWGAIALRQLHRNLPRAVAIIVILTNTVNILGPILVGKRAIELFGDDIIGVITAVLTFGTIIFSEIIPKSVGAHEAPRISRAAATPILALVWALYPLVWILERLANLFRSGTRPIGTEEQIRALVRIGRRAGHIESDEDQLIHRAFILNDKTAADVMTPLASIAAVRHDATIRQAADQVFRNTYSRYPVFGKNPDDIRGIVMSHDILEALTEGRDAESVETILREVPVVMARMRSDALLLLFRDRAVHLAVVKDGGKTVGLVTLEDVLEELVGEIEDEMDVE